MFNARLLRSKYLIIVIVGVLLFSKVIFDGGNYLYYGFRYESRIFSPVEFYLGKSYRVLNSFIGATDPGLPVVQIFLPEKAQQQLLADPPQSTKRWKQGFVAFEGREMQAAKIRHRGEAIRNYGHLKKSWKFKVKKKEFYGRQRVFNFIVPRGGMLGDHIPYWLAEEISLPTPAVSLAELHLNGQNHGILLMAQQPDESFLRNAGFMPVNLYKGEPDDGTGLVGPLGDLFNSLAGWSKQAVNNTYAKEDRSDLRRFLSLIARAPANPDAFAALKALARDEEWVKFAVFQELTQSTHNNRHANIRIIFDDWRGATIPIPWDTTFKYFGGEPKFDRSSHEVFTIYMQRSDFLLKKYQLLYRLLNEQAPLERVAQRLERLEPALEASLGRDAAFQAWSTRVFGFWRRKEILRTSRADFVAKIRDLSVKLKKRLNGMPTVSWTPDRNGFSLMIDKQLPISDITLVVAPAGKAALYKRGFWLDLDRDGIVSSGDMALPFSEHDQEITIHGSWLANRVVPSVNEFTQHLASSTALHTKIQETRFPIVTKEPLIIQKISARNALNGQLVSVPKGAPAGVSPARWNRPIVPKPAGETAVWSGTVTVDADRIISTATEITAGTVIRIAPGASLIFRNRLVVNGTKAHPVIVDASKADKPWGVLALQGQETAGSVLRYVELRNGSGAMVDGIRYTGMFSIHDTKNVTVENFTMDRNVAYDDMFHIVYGNDISLSSIILRDAQSDALDIDISTVNLAHVEITNAGNDGIDLMESKATIRHAAIFNSGDKGISVGEGSRVSIFDSQISNSAIGIESKDRSNVVAFHLQLNSNATQLSAYRKNWRYGQGGNMHIKNSKIGGSENRMNIRRGSHIRISGSNLYPRPTFRKTSHIKRFQVDSDVTFDKSSPTTAKDQRQ